MDGPKCSWCGTDIGRDEGFRATEPEGERTAAFCRLQHVVPWAIQGAHWDPGRILAPGDPGDGLGRCAHCGGPPRDPPAAPPPPPPPPPAPPPPRGPPPPPPP